MLLGLAGCGGGSSSSSTATSTTSASTSTASAASSTGSGKVSAAVTTGPVRGAFHGMNHAPRVGKPWRYSVVVTDASGHPLAGTVDIDFTFGGQIVGHDTPRTKTLKHGIWHDVLTFPAQSVGEPLAVQARVHTSAGSIVLGWPITVVS